MEKIGGKKKEKKEGIWKQPAQTSEPSYMEKGKPTWFVLSVT